ncbi:3-phosphoshikimate 1-carboxyvinyltransferase [Coxiella endosymbiont of Amblyomma americanum]|uniref:3-phosphoshikimate 1-carboxyvinyltransferase n=1 Tax=Coxiella endosymbiont of Amblyomma americanum TaxID=325775 RepID=UPI00057CDAC3|nr:3-phosphoshikimate 1-carboxyvinyltransferase [Coxiella endosymbiont of Amblyomma americanum]AJC50650.1 3-phosphoshikimate 1-carboxyvinyltransferase [Coxiella endosymbiont of Amblyomma americanum]AUJ59066.1 3-phosphoshikimate 1-carboxyvinyltransferase [Coxiella-like endosymbiont of Amblyomma americanum]
MNCCIIPSNNLRGIIDVPGDKSISHRAVILAAIAKGKTRIKGFLMGEDNLATVRAFQHMGVVIKVIKNKNVLLVNGVGKDGLNAPRYNIDCGNSGTSIRLLAGLLSGQPFVTNLTGDRSLRNRPMKRIIDPLVKMGVRIDSNRNFPPLKITGNPNLKGIHYRLPIASAQVKSCLLLAGLYAKGETCIIELTTSRDHTERLLKQVFKYPIRIKNLQTCLSGNGPTLKTRKDIIVPGDISSAAFFIVAATIVPGSSICLRQVGINPTRIGVINLLRMMGAQIKIVQRHIKNKEPTGNILVHYAPLKGIDIPKEQIPLAIDEFPILLVAAAVAQGKTILRGAKELRVKETDRIAVMAEGLKKLGINVQLLPDGLIVQGGKFQGGTISSYHDHRIAMAFSIAGILAKSAVCIQNCENINTSFPNFITLARRIGIKLKVF